MTPLYVYDFDKTLVPYDSFRRYLLHLLRLRPVTVGILLFLRKMRLISALELKAWITKIVQHSKILQRDARYFAHRIIYDMHVPCALPKGAKVLLISASPAIYMKHIAELITWSCICSDFVNDKYVEMYGENKLDALHRDYPTSEYDYVYAASDSESDLCWMKEFKQYEIINLKGKRIRNHKQII